MKYLHAENGNPDSGVTDVVVKSESGFCLVIKGRCHQGVLCCLLGEQMASLLEPWRRRRGLCDPHPGCCACLHEQQRQPQRRTDLKEVPNNCRRVVSPSDLAIKHPKGQLVSSEVIRALSEFPSQRQQYTAHLLQTAVLSRGHLV